MIIYANTEYMNKKTTTNNTNIINYYKILYNYIYIFIIDYLSKYKIRAPEGNRNQYTFTYS